METDGNAYDKHEENMKLFKKALWEAMSNIFERMASECIGKEKAPEDNENGKNE